jgi:hypothetical protein
MSPRRQVLAWEQRWSRPVALVTLAAVLLIVASLVVAAKGVGGGSGDADLLTSVDAHRSAELISSVLQALGVGLLAAPLYFLFRAANARSDRMRGQLVGLVIAAPLFLAVSAILGGFVSLDAASDFAAAGLTGTGDHANKVASDSLAHASLLRNLAGGFALGGRFGLAVALFYTCLNAMRVGLLSRLWGSLGMALGAASFVVATFFFFTLLWLVYLAFLLLGRVPGGKPPAWETGEAIPWPTPGDKAAAELTPPAEDPTQADEDDAPSANEQEKPVEKGPSQ